MVVTGEPVEGGLVEVGGSPVVGGEVEGGLVTVGGGPVEGGLVMVGSGPDVGGLVVALQTCHQKVIGWPAMGAPEAEMARRRKVLAVGLSASVWPMVQVPPIGDLPVTWISAGTEPSPCGTVQNPLASVVHDPIPPLSDGGAPCAVAWRAANPMTSTSAALNAMTCSLCLKCDAPSLVGGASTIETPAAFQRLSGHSSRSISHKTLT